MVDFVTYLTAFGFGLSASFYPCLFPVLPSFIAFVSAREEKRASIINGVATSVLVTLGIMTVFVVFGLLFNGIIGFFADNYNNFRTLQGIILAILGLLLILGISITVPKIWEVSAFAHNYISRFQNPWVVAYIIGFFFALLAAPCAIILFLTVFALIAGATLIDTILLMVFFSLGAGIPFIIIGVLIPAIRQGFEERFDTSKSVLLSSHKINQYLPRIIGVVILITGLALIIGIDTFNITEWPIIGELLMM
ncbi:MAG: cytochrome c biogenesis CcdA family protein [Candidatus Odinarchaeota archaeon]